MTTAQKLRDIFRDMDPARAQEIREAYYKAVEGLATLAEALEIADTQTDGDQLLDEHFIAVNAIEAMNASRLGAVL